MNAIALIGGTLDTEEQRERVRSTVAHAAKEYAEAKERIAELWAEINRQTDRIDAVFPDASHNFKLRLSFMNSRGYDEHELDKIFIQMKRNAWRVLAGKLGIRSVMSIEDRRKFDKELEQGDLPEITEQMVLDTIFGLVGQANEFAAKACREVFDMLRQKRGYKTNDVFRVGKRVILTYAVDNWATPRINYNREPELTAMEGVFLLLDGKTALREGRAEIITAFNASGKERKAATDYFAIKGFKNGNLHIEFKRLDLVKQLNGIAVGDYVLGSDWESES